MKNAFEDGEAAVVTICLAIAPFSLNNMTADRARTIVNGLPPASQDNADKAMWANEGIIPAVRRLHSFGTYYDIGG